VRGRKSDPATARAGYLVPFVDCDVLISARLKRWRWRLGGRFSIFKASWHPLVRDLRWRACADPFGGSCEQILQMTAIG
jgi:hypothetical protein